MTEENKSKLEDYRVICDTKFNADVYNGNVSVLNSAILNQPMHINFSGNSKLFLNKDGKLEFEGNMEKSAEEFLTYLCQIFNKQN